MSYIGAYVELTTKKVLTKNAVKLCCGVNGRFEDNYCGICGTPYFDSIEEKLEYPSFYDFVDNEYVDLMANIYDWGGEHRGVFRLICNMIDNGKESHYDADHHTNLVISNDLINDCIDNLKSNKAWQEFKSNVIDNNPVIESMEIKFGYIGGDV